LNQSKNDGEIAPLTTEEQGRYRTLKRTIDNEMGAFLRVGSALIEIHDKKLYRGEFKTWEMFCRDKFNLGRSQADRLMKSASAVEKMSPIGDKKLLPLNEYQVRELLRLKSVEERQEVWAEVVAKAETGEGGLTAKEIGENIAQRNSNGDSNRRPEKVPPDDPDLESVNAGEASAGDSEGKQPGNDNEEVVERVSAILLNGEEVPDALWENGYLDAECVQTKLDKVKDTPRQVDTTDEACQLILLALQGAINGIMEADNTRERRNACYDVVREVLRDAMVVASRTGDLRSTGTEARKE
jgi:hypothetical protein